MRLRDALPAAVAAAALLACAAPSSEQPPTGAPAATSGPASNFAGTAATATEGPRYGLGRRASEAQVAAVNIDIQADGGGLPAGSGSATEGATLYQAKCAMCHGPQGQGMAKVYPALVGPQPPEFAAFARDAALVRSIGNYWSHATTLYDYIRRAMPLTAPGSLTDDEVYALAAYLLAANDVIPKDATLDAASLVAVKMPARDRFIPDDRRGGPEVK